MIPHIERNEQTELKEQKALLLNDSVYFYNHVTNTISTYTVFKEGFSYSVIRHELETFLKQFNFIWLARHNDFQKAYKSKELSPIEFSEFVNQITVLQEQTHALRPLVSFDNYINILIEKSGLKLK